jgi:hypothetical protein
MIGVLDALRRALGRRLLGISAEEIRYTFEDVRSELRATRAELKEELAALRSDVERLGRERGDANGASDEEPAAEA